MLEAPVKLRADPSQSKDADDDPMLNL
jgi:hypothetical protein